MQSDGIDPVPKGLLTRFRAVEGYAGGRTEEEPEPKAAASGAGRRQAMVQEQEVPLLIQNLELRMRRPPCLCKHRHMNLEALHVTNKLIHLGVGTHRDYLESRARSETRTEPVNSLWIHGAGNGNPERVPPRKLQLDTGRRGVELSAGSAKDKGQDILYIMLRNTSLPHVIHGVCV